MTEPDTSTSELRALTPEQFLARFSDEPEHSVAGQAEVSLQASGPVDRSGTFEDRVDGNTVHHVSADYAVPATVARPPLPPRPSRAAQDRQILRLPPRSMLRLSNGRPTEH